MEMNSSLRKGKFKSMRNRTSLEMLSERPIFSDLKVLECLVKHSNPESMNADPPKSYHFYLNLAFSNS